MGIYTQTLTQLHKSIISSLLENSRIIYPRISNSTLEIIERIEFKFIKIIHKIPKYASNSLVKELAAYQSIRERFDTLNTSYLQKCLDKGNDILSDLFENYLNYSNGRNLKNESLYCIYKNTLKIASTWSVHKKNKLQDHSYSQYQLQ